MKLQLIATCLFGLEKLLGEEIDALGLKRIETIDGRVTFEGDLADVARANIHLRCVEHVFICLGKFSATTFDELFEGTKALAWENWIGKLDAFPVDVWMRRAIDTYFGGSLNPKSLGRYAGIAQQYIFHYIRNTGG